MKRALWAIAFSWALAVAVGATLLLCSGCEPRVREVLVPIVRTIYVSRDRPCLYNPPPALPSETGEHGHDVARLKEWSREIDLWARLYAWQLCGAK